jgi:hypothetical protein
VALCDVFDEKMAAPKQIGVENPRLYRDLNELLASDVDAVIIATPVCRAGTSSRGKGRQPPQKPASVDVEVTASCARLIRKLNITFSSSGATAGLSKGKLADSIGRFTWPMRTSSRARVSDARR